MDGSPLQTLSHIRIDRRTSARLTAGLAATCVLALAACSPGSSTSASSTTSSSTSSSAAAASKVTLVSTRPRKRLGHHQGVHQGPGIPVRLDDNSTGPLLTQIEASKNNPTWGLPASWQQLLGTQWNGQVGMNNRPGPPRLSRSSRA